MVDFLNESSPLLIKGLETNFVQGCVVLLETPQDELHPRVRNSMASRQFQFAERSVLAKSEANVLDFLVPEPIEPKIQGLQGRIHAQQFPDHISVEYAIAAQVQMRQVAVAASLDRIGDPPRPHGTDAIPPQVQMLQVWILVHPFGQFDRPRIPKDSQTQCLQMMLSKQEWHCLGKQLQGISQIEVQMGHRPGKGSNGREYRLRTLKDGSQP